MKFLEELAQALTSARTEESGVEIALHDVQDTDIPVLVRLGFTLNRETHVWELAADKVEGVITKVETEGKETPDEAETETDTETPASPAGADSQVETPANSGQGSGTDSPVTLTNDDAAARILELERQVQAATERERNVIIRARRQRMNDALAAATERGVAAGLINDGKTMLTALLPVMEGPTLLTLSAHGQTEQLDMFDSLVHFFASIPGIVPTDRQGDEGLRRTEQELEDEQYKEAAKSLMQPQKR